MSPVIHCLGCGATFVEAVGPCIHCGGEVELSVPLTGVAARAISGCVGAVADEVIADEDQRTRYTAPSGAQSTSALVDGEVYVTVPHDPSFWREVAKGFGSVQVDIRVAVGWVNYAIVEKAKRHPQAVQQAMLLAVDIAHIGILSTPALADSYLATYGDPSDNHDFAGVWLVGPTESRCTRLGKSRW